MRVSYLEIYNNDGYDLLRNEDQQKKKLEELPKVCCSSFLPFAAVFASVCESESALHALCAGANDYRQKR